MAQRIDLQNARPSDHFFIWSNNHIVQINHKDLLYISSENRTLTLEVRDRNRLGHTLCYTSHAYSLKGFNFLIDLGFDRIARWCIAQKRHICSYSTDKVVSFNCQTQHTVYCSKEYYQAHVQMANLRRAQQEKRPACLPAASQKPLWATSRQKQPEPQCFGRLCRAT